MPTNTTREALIATTSRLIEKQGLHATGLNQIVRESGASRGSLYHYFAGGKDEMAAEAASYASARVRARMAQALASDPDTGSAMRRFVTIIASLIERTEFAQGAPLTAVALETSSSNETVRIACATGYQSWSAELESAFRAKGLSRDAAASLSHLTLSAIEGGIVLARAMHDTTPLQNVADEVAIIINQRLSEGQKEPS